MSGSNALRHEAGVPDFAPDWALFLDVDGTLLDIAGHPDAVTVAPGLHDLLERVHRLNDGAVALISGRSLSDLDRLFGPLRFCAAGQHGLERRDREGLITRSIGAMERINEAAQALATHARMHEGAVVEHKGLSLALHYRNAPGLADWAARTMQSLLAALGPAFQLVQGKMVLELKPGGRDKGTAIADFLSEPPFAGRLPVFVGDDATDEDGFAVANLAGGHSIKVGEGASAARWRLADARAVRGWLEAYTDFLATGAAR
ncbi:MAG TPA: trehalose-phosphatase [Burkholderiales bacterium]|nr:trehalose-phosphatase [Burkholderiales bacterium]